MKTKLAPHHEYNLKRADLYEIFTKKLIKVDYEKLNNLRFTFTENHVGGAVQSAFGWMETSEGFDFWCRKNRNGKNYLVGSNNTII